MIVLELWLSARSLPFLLIGRDLQRSLALANVGATSRFAGVDPVLLVDLVGRVCRHPLFMRKRRCLRLSLLGFRALRMAGLSPEIRFAVVAGSIAGRRLDAHCWVSLDGAPILGVPGPDMVEIYRFPPHIP